MKVLFVSSNWEMIYLITNLKLVGYEHQSKEQFRRGLFITIVIRAHGTKGPHSYLTKS